MKSYINYRKSAAVESCPNFYLISAVFLGGIRGKINRCGWNEKWAQVPETLKRPLLLNSIPCPETIHPAEIDAFIDYYQ